MNIVLRKCQSCAYCWVCNLLHKSLYRRMMCKDRTSEDVIDRDFEAWFFSKIYGANNK